MSAASYYRPRLPMGPISYISSGLHNPLALLFGFSSVSLSDYELSLLNFASNSRKQLQKLMDGMIENLAEAHAARWVIELRKEEDAQ